MIRNAAYVRSGNFSGRHRRKKKRENTILLALHECTFLHSLGQTRTSSWSRTTSALTPGADIKHEKARTPLWGVGPAKR